MVDSEWLVLFSDVSWMVAHPARFSADQSAHAFFLYESLSSLCALMHGTVALLAAKSAAPLKPKHQPLVQQTDPCLCGYMANRCTALAGGAVAGPLEGQLQTTCQSMLHLNHLPITQPAGYTPLSM